MRFGIPSSFQLEVETKAPTVPRLVLKGIDRIDDIKVILQELCNEWDNDEPVQFPQLKSFYDSIEKFNSKMYEQNRHRVMEYNSFLNSLILEKKLFTDAAVNAVTESFGNRLSLQSQQVTKLVNKEEERIKIEKEKKKREEEELARRKENEKKLAEEKEKKLEAARKLKEEEEKIRIAKEEEEKRKIKEEERRKKNEEEKKHKLKSSSGQIENEFLKYKKDISDIKQNVVLKINENKDLKRQVNQLKRKLNPKFGQLSNSTLQLQKINIEIIDLIRSMESTDELALKWILNFIAKAIIDQAEMEVIVQTTAAIPLARLACSLLNTFSDFDYFLIARFVKKCPFIIGYTCSIDSEEGRIRMGWKRKEEKWEDDIKYDERLAGICTVWCTMTRIEDFPQKINYSFESSWRFLARLLNTNAVLLTNTHFSVAGSWWETCATYFLRKYGQQATKLLNVLSIEWPATTVERNFPAAMRLLILGEEWKDKNRIETIKEMES
ncbi:uncharacterized protein PRCAT00001651001 [Priceomyces carsonii]|uniref:uncharacterized protein n=1 Tax=Priceomyces carsonii TaxID=28549 RepID=UPI002EDB7E75|nr:unnamed protein product [Priceomyces carsonii]